VLSRRLLSRVRPGLSLTRLRKLWMQCSGSARLSEGNVDESSRTASQTGTWRRTTSEFTDSKWHDQRPGRRLIGMSCNQMGEPRSSPLQRRLWQTPDICPQWAVPVSPTRAPDVLVPDAYCLR